MLSLTSILLLCLLASALGALLGGMGGTRAIRRRMNELESDIVSIADRLIREQKRRAGIATQDDRRANMAEAEAIAARVQSQPRTVSLPGRARSLNE